MRVYEKIIEAVRTNNARMALDASRQMDRWKFGTELQELYARDLTGAAPSEWRDLVWRGAQLKEAIPIGFQNQSAEETK